MSNINPNRSPESCPPVDSSFSDNHLLGLHISLDVRIQLYHTQSGHTCLKLTPDMAHFSSCPDIPSIPVIQKSDVHFQSATLDISLMGVCVLPFLLYSKASIGAFPQSISVDLTAVGLNRARRAGVGMFDSDRILNVPFDSLGSGSDNVCCSLWFAGVEPRGPWLYRERVGGGLLTSTVGTPFASLWCSKGED